MSESERRYLSDPQSKGKFIEIQGFISASKSLDTAKKFAGNMEGEKCIIKFSIKKVDSQKARGKDYGFADIESISRVEGEEEVLFNILNIFEIVGSHKDEDGYLLIELAYGTIFDKLEQNDLSEAEKYTVSSFEDMVALEASISNFGDVYMRTNKYEKALKYWNIKQEEHVNLKQAATDTYEIKLKKADAYKEMSDFANCFKELNELKK